MTGRRILFVNPHVATQGRLADRRLPAPYQQLASFFWCGILDRTRTLDCGFDYDVVDPIPEVAVDAPRPSFAEVCTTVAERLVDEALSSQRAIQILWSGGIDSTVALVALTTALESKGALEALEVLLTLDSIKEYARFYREHIQGKLATRPIAHPVAQYLEPNKLLVTGEHGDQLFGSDKAESYVRSGLAKMRYDQLLPVMLMDKLGNMKKVDETIAYLEPQLARCPVPLETVYDLFWWLNFSLKWQQVTFRIPIFAKTQIERIYSATRHFFREREFQVWSMQNRDKKIGDTWGSYKYEAKDYIYSFTQDERYRKRKCKQVSLRAISPIARANRGRRRQMVYMWSDFEACFEVFELKPQWSF